MPEGGTARLTLDYPARVPRPGLHALILRLDYHEGEPPAPENERRTSQLAFIVFPLGGHPPPAIGVETEVGELRLTGTLPVRVESLDAAPHRVRLRLHTAPGVGAHPRVQELEVPASGSVAAPFRLLRSGAPSGTRHGVLVQARVLDGPLERTSVAAGVVDVAGAASRVRRYRVPLLVLAAALIAAAVAVERRRRARPAPPNP